MECLFILCWLLNVNSNPSVALVSRPPLQRATKTPGARVCLSIASTASAHSEHAGKNYMDRKRSAVSTFFSGGDASMNKYGIMPELLPAPACAISLPRGVPSWMAATWCDAGLALTQAHSRSFIGSPASSSATWHASNAHCMQDPHAQRSLASSISPAARKQQITHVDGGA